MKVINHILQNDDGSAIPFFPSHNYSGLLEQEYVILHYTGGNDAESAKNWLIGPQSHASAHVIIDRDGSILQLIPFDKIAWHVGKSIWENREGLNKYSIGIELVNAGKLVRSGNSWISWFGKTYPDSEVVEAIHKNEMQSSGWHKYTQTQIEKTSELVKLIVSKYNIKDVLGHEDVAPGFKLDPGPAFPMAEFRENIFGTTSSKMPEEILINKTSFNVFFSYAHEDETFRDSLEKHLSLLQRKGIINNWHDRRIAGGENWNDEIKTHLVKADIILLLISSDFLASDYCYEKELKLALERHSQKKAKVIPIIVRPCDWHGAPFEELQMLPKDAKPVSSYGDVDEAFLEISIAIRNIINEI